jgi:glutaredoxin 3
MKPVKIYTANYCGYCARAKELLLARGIPYQEVDLTGDDAAREDLVRLAGGRRTVPQIFIGSTHVGGYSDLVRVDAEGKLDGLLT